MPALSDKKIGFAMTGSHCTLESIFRHLEKMIGMGAEIFPIISPSVQTTDTRFGRASAWSERLTLMTGKQPACTIVEAEPIGPQKLLDILLIAPCTGNTMAKLANGVTDNVVLMAAKAHLRNCRPLLLAISTNDGLGLNAKNLAVLINAKNIFLVPFGQDSPQQKPHSLVAINELIIPALLAALEGKQLQPLLVMQETEV